MQTIKRGKTIPCDNSFVTISERRVTTAQIQPQRISRIYQHLRGVTSQLETLLATLGLLGKTHYPFTSV